MPWEHDDLWLWQNISEHETDNFTCRLHARIAFGWVMFDRIPDRPLVNSLAEKGFLALHQKLLKWSRV